MVRQAKEKNSSEFLPTAGIEPRPPAQPPSAPYSAPLHLSFSSNVEMLRELEYLSLKKYNLSNFRKVHFSLLIDSEWKNVGEKGWNFFSSFFDGLIISREIFLFTQLLIIKFGFRLVKFIARIITTSEARLQCYCCTSALLFFINL